MQEILSHLPVLLKTSGEASILILLVLAAQWLCGPRLQPRWRYALWLLVLLRLALPWTVPSPASLFNVLKIPAAAPQVRAEPPPIKTKNVPIADSRRVATVASSPRINWLAWLWATGALLLTGCAVVSQYKFRRRVRRLRPLTDGPTLSLLEDCKALMGVSTPVSLVETEAINSPTLFGFVRPRLLLPTGLVSTFTREELRHVFLHELAHIKRLDILTGWVALGLQIVHWFNPLIWLAFYRLRADRELACDALALSSAGTGENKAYGLTIVKLLEGFGQPVWGPGQAGILENKHQMKERISMIAKFRKTDRGLVLAIMLLAGLALVTLTDAQNQTPHQPTKIGKLDTATGVWAIRSDHAQFDTNTHQVTYFGHVRVDGPQMKLASERLTVDQSPSSERVMSITAETNVVIDGGTNHITCDRAVFAFTVQNGITNVTMTVTGRTKLITDDLDASQGVWAVRFKPVGDFAPRTPGEFLSRIHIYSGQDGEIGYFRTTKQGDKLIGSFLASDPDQLKAALNKVPGIKVISVEKLTQETLAAYEKSPQESLVDFDHLDASRGVWAVRFEPVGGFSPRTPGEFLAKIPVYSGQHGEIGYFRTKKQGDKLVGSFLAYDGTQLKAALAALPDIKVTSVEKLTQEQITDYENSPQESFVDFDHLDASKGVWVVRFEPAGDFSPRTPEEYLARIHVYSGQHGMIGYFRTQKQGDRLVGSFLANDGDQLKAALAAVPDIKVISVEKLTQEQLVEYEKLPQESTP
jgi:beta-lactamase regulating signal transducer with metallopeptidase domain